MNGYLIALAVLLLWIALVIYLKKSGWLERHGLSLFGPMIMWKTRKGREFIDRLSSRKLLWGVYGKLGLWVCAGAMVTIMTLLLWEATIVSRIEKAPSPELILGIPGLNPVIPLWYGILGLVVAIVVHELAHGIMTRLGEMKLVSLGVLFFVFPVGAFVEPDEKELQATSRRKRARVFAAGPATNILLSLVVLGLFSGVMMSSVEPVDEGALALGVIEDSPAHVAGLSRYSLITAIDGNDIRSEDDFEDYDQADPGESVSVAYLHSGERVSDVSVTYGLVVSFTVEGYAADDAGLSTGMILASVNGTTVRNIDELSDALALTSAGQEVSIQVFSLDGQTGSFEADNNLTSLVLSDKYEFYSEYYPDDNEESFRGRGYLGAGFLLMGVSVADADYYSSILANPFAEVGTVDEFSRAWLRLIALPFLDLAPMRAPLTDVYTPSGALDWMPDDVFWVLANSLYWIFWLNLMLGLTNVLPAVPLDGGYLFRDTIDYLLGRSGKRLLPERREAIVGIITVMVAFLVLGLIVWQLVGPAIMN